MVVRGPYNQVVHADTLRNEIHEGSRGRLGMEMANPQSECCLMPWTAFTIIPVVWWVADFFFLGSEWWWWCSGYMPVYFPEVVSVVCVQNVYKMHENVHENVWSGVQTQNRGSKDGFTQKASTSGRYKNRKFVPIFLGAVVLLNCGFEWIILNIVGFACLFKLLAS